MWNLRPLQRADMNTPCRGPTQSLRRYESTKRTSLDVYTCMHKSRMQDGNTDNGFNECCYKCCGREDTTRTPAGAYLRTATTGWSEARLQRHTGSTPGRSSLLKLTYCVWCLFFSTHDRWSTRRYEDEVMNEDINMPTAAEERDYLRRTQNDAGSPLSTLVDVCLHAASMEDKR